MKSIYRITFLLMLSAFVAQAQTKPQNFISLSGGVAMPIGNFASSTINDPTSGFAQMGSHFALDGAYFFNRHFGIGGNFSTSSFNVDATSLASRYLDSYDCDSAMAKAGPYHTISFLVGPYFTMPFGKLNIDFRVLGGITNTMIPDFIGTVINDRSDPTQGSISTFAQTATNANAFGFQAGLGLRYKLSDHMLISLRGDYFYSKPDLSLDNINRSNASGIILSSYNEAVSGINASLGIGYLF